MQHVLICRTDNLGDVVLTLPLAGYLRQRFPDLRIGFLCRRYAAELVATCTALDYVVERETIETSPPGAPVASKDAVANAAAWMKKAGVDTIIFAKPDRRLAAAAKKAGIARRVGTSHRLFNWWYCNRLAHFSRVKSGLHEAQLNFELLKPLGIEHIPALSEVAGLYGLQVAPLAISQSKKPVGLNQNDFNLLLHPKSNGNGREWPPARYLGLAKYLSTDPRIRLWVTGSAPEGEWLASHVPELFTCANVQNLCGKLTLAELQEFIRSADGLVASGTGPVHIAAAVGQRTLGLYPPLKPIHPARWAPLGAQAQAITGAAECQGCNYPRQCACMDAISVSSVAKTVERWQAEKLAADGDR
ncbi:MAG: glycosyltransferase family 9 protein [Herminiimonas sp.]|nr:glycosyltransferase family 9 protein [Herminiimonas sp.]